MLYFAIFPICYLTPSFRTIQRNSPLGYLRINEILVKQRLKAGWKRELILILNYQHSLLTPLHQQHVQESLTVPKPKQSQIKLDKIFFLSPIQGFIRTI